MISLTRTQALLAVVPLVALLAVAGSRIAASGTSEGRRVAQPIAVADTPTAQAPRLVVHVVGAVRRAGLYRVVEGARVADAIARAGGPSRRADLASVNLAAPVVDGQQVVVPRRLPNGAVPASGPAAGAKVSLSSATVEQLDELPGVGPVTAQKIVDWRAAHPLRSVDDLDAIPGIGPARIEQLRDLVQP